VSITQQKRPLFTRS